MQRDEYFAVMSTMDTTTENLEEWNATAILSLISTADVRTALRGLDHRITRVTRVTQVTQVSRRRRRTQTSKPAPPPGRRHRCSPHWFKGQGFAEGSRVRGFKGPKGKGPSRSHPLSRATLGPLKTGAAHRTASGSKSCEAFGRSNRRTEASARPSLARAPQNRLAAPRTNLAVAASRWRPLVTNLYDWKTADHREAPLGYASAGRIVLRG